MKPGYFTPISLLCAGSVIAGVILIICSWTPLVPPFATEQGVRAAGFVLLFLGIGEYLNHPLRNKRLLAQPTDTAAAVVPTRERRPCALGNIFVVLAVISFFMTLSYLFFQAGQ